MQLRGLECFVAVADEGTFRAAAAVLHLTQQAVSAQVRGLEAEAGAPLFVRGAHGVRPTEAGLRLLPHARRVLEDAANARRVLTGAGGLSGRLRIAYKPGVLGALTPVVLRRFALRHPDVELALVDTDWSDQTAVLRDRRADVGFVRLPVHAPELRLEPVFTEPRVAIVARDHPHAARAALPIAAFADDPVVMADRAPEAWNRWWLVDPRPDGRRAVRGPTADSAGVMLELVATGRAIAIGVASAQTVYRRDDVAFVTLTDVEPSRVALAWPRTSSSPVTAAFARAVRELLAERPEPLADGADAGTG